MTRAIAVALGGLRVAAELLTEIGLQQQKISRHTLSTSPAGAD
jgi:hypothetical protein